VGFQIARILCPTDFSQGSHVALEVAAAIAQRFDASVDVLHVWTPPTIVAFDAAIVPSPEDLTALTESLQLSLDAAIAKLPLPRERVDKHLVQGSDWREIIEVAERLRSDLIVVGTHGRTGVSHLLLGSVAEKVVRTAKRPVLTVPLRAA
jgi:universal stress protein A